MSAPTARTVFLALHASTPCDWPRILQILSWHGYQACIPQVVLPVRRLGMAARLAHRRQQTLLEPARHSDGVTRVAGGPVGDLDLHALAADARVAAEQRWWTWHNLVATSTPAAKPWTHYRAAHLADPKKVSEADARRQFETQPRVLAMLAYNTYPGGAHQFRLEELDGYQAGQAVYVALHWQQSLTGDVLIDPHGRLLQPASPSLADRLRYLAEATRVVHALTARDHLAAVRAVRTTDPAFAAIPRPGGTAPDDTHPSRNSERSTS